MSGGTDFGIYFDFVVVCKGPILVFHFIRNYKFIIYRFIERYNVENSTEFTIWSGKMG